MSGEVQDEVWEMLIFTCKAEIVGEDLEKRQYLKAAINGTHHLHPFLLLLIPSEAGDDIKLMGYDGYDIGTGTMLMTNT